MLAARASAVVVMTAPRSAGHARNRKQAVTNRNRVEAALLRLVEQLPDDARREKAGALAPPAAAMMIGRGQLAGVACNLAHHRAATSNLAEPARRRRRPFDGSHVMIVSQPYRQGYNDKPTPNDQGRPQAAS